MIKKFRLLILFLLTLLFLVFAPITLLYSWGWRFDFATGKITKTGGFYFKVLPKAAEIHISGKEPARTDLFFGAAFLDNLLPKSYKIEIKKNGYHSWRKTLEVQEEKVTEAKNVVLFPKNPDFQIISQNVEKFFVSPDQQQMILKETEKDGFSLKLLELDKDIKSPLADESDLDKTQDSSLQEFVDSFFGLDKEATTSQSIEQSIKDTEDKESEQQISEGKLSPDTKKLVYLAGTEIWVQFLKDELGQPQKEAGERLLIARFSEKIDDIYWLTSHYLVFNTGDKIKIAEIDDRDKINIIDFAEFKKPKIFFSQPNKKLYILSQGDLYVSKNLLP